MTMLTERVVRELEQVGPIIFCNWSAGTSRHGFGPWARRVTRMLLAVNRLVIHGRKLNSRLYITANSKGAIALTALLVYIGCLLGYRVYLHHHTYTYIDCRSRWMAWIDRRMKRQGVHIVHCRKMANDFRRQYESQCQFVTIHPSIVTFDVQRPRAAMHQPFRLGHLSNLSVAKGLDLVIRTFEALLSAGVEVQLRLAGPCLTREAEQLVSSVLVKYPDSVRHFGPIYNDDKKQYFADIDAFLFPTESESWGIVINEAIAAGVPVITFDRGCTQTVVGNEAGIAIDPRADFVAAATEQVRRWIDDPDEYAMMSQAAIEQARRLHRKGRVQLDQFVEQIFTTREITSSSDNIDEAAC